MRVTSFVAAAFVLVLAGSVFAQEPWAEFSSPRDGFRITLPGTPKAEDVTWASQMAIPCPRASSPLIVAANTIRSRSRTGS